MTLPKTTENFSISLPSYLITIMDKTCGEKDFCRSTFIKLAVKKYLLHHHNKPFVWDAIYDKALGK